MSHRAAQAPCAINRKQREVLTRHLNAAWGNKKKLASCLQRPFHNLWGGTAQKRRRSPGHRRRWRRLAPLDSPVRLRCWTGWPMRGVRVGEAAHPGPRSSTETTHEVVLRADFSEGLVEASEHVAEIASRQMFSQSEWAEAVEKTFPRSLTLLLNGQPVKLPKKLAGPWAAFQKLNISQRPGQRSL